MGGWAGEGLREQVAGVWLSGGRGEYGHISRAAPPLPLSGEGA